MARKSLDIIPLFEAQIARTCSDFLQADGWRLLITDPVSNRQLGKGFGEPGMADRLYMRYLTPYGSGASEVMWIEWKRVHRGRATRPTPLQLIWHQHERARGALTLIAGIDFPATIEGFIEYYRKSGLMRKRRL